MAATDSPGKPRKRGLRIGAVLAVAVAIGVAAFLVFRDDDEESAPAPARTQTAATVADLREAADTTGHPVFWAGPRAGYTYELTVAGGNTYVRYLPPGTAVGDPQAKYLTIGTYPLADGYERLKAVARRARTDEQRIARDGLVVIGRDRPSSVYLAYPSGKYQIEVFAPSPARAKRLVVEDRIRSVG